MSDLETRLRAAMHGETDDTSAPSGLAAQTLARGARVRRRRRVVAGVSLVAVAALVVPVWQGVTRAGTPPKQPFTHTPTPRSTITGPPLSVGAWLAKLPNDGPPGVWYYSNQTMVDGGDTYRFQHAQNVFGPVQNGLGMNGPSSSPPSYGVLSPTGQYTPLGQGVADGMAGSPDGSQVVVGLDSKLVVYRGGQAVQSMPTSFSPNDLTWFGNTLYFTTGGYGGGPTPHSWAWQPGSATPPHQVPVQINSFGVGVWFKHRCLVVLKASQSGQLTQSRCVAAPNSVLTYDASPDGTKVAFAVPKQGTTQQRLEVLSVATGQVTVLTPWIENRLTSAPGPEWESNQAVLWVLQVSTRGDQATDAMVRCDVDTSCSAALRGVQGTADDFEPPLYLAPYLSY